MISELETVVLVNDLPEENLKAGDVGTVVSVYNNGEAYDVEFVATDGNTIALKTLKHEMIRSTFGRKEILHVRELL